MINGLNCLLHYVNEGLGFFFEEKTGGEKTKLGLILKVLAHTFQNCGCTLSSFKNVFFLTEKIPVNQKLIILKKKKEKKKKRRDPSFCCKH